METGELQDAAEQTTRDTLWGGALSLRQPARGCGYRFNLDPVLLSGEVEGCDRVLELGAGCGILSLLLLGWGRCHHATAVEVQGKLADLCRANASDNAVADRLEVVAGDLRTYEAARPFDAVVFNPPYFPAGAGRGSPHQGRDSARHERHGTLADFVACAERNLTQSGCLYAVVRWQRAEELLKLCDGAGLGVTRLRPVVARVGADPGHALVTAKRNSDARLPRKQCAPLIVHAGAGRAYTSDVEVLLSGPPNPFAV